MEYIPQKLLVVSGGGTYPKMLIGVAIALMHGIVAHPGTCMVER